MKTYTAIILLAALISQGCNKAIDSVRPLTKIDAEGVMATPQGILEVTAGNYKEMRGNGYNDMCYHLLDFGESRGNNLKLADLSVDEKNSDAYFYRNSPFLNRGGSNGFYRQSYQIILSTNIVMKGIDELETMPGLTAGDQHILKYARGENLFLRALTYFNLIRNFGKPYYHGASTPGVPIKTSTDVNDLPGRSTVQAVYEFMIKDLQEAAQLMKVPATRSNFFASTGSAWALLSRIYLYMGGSVANPVNGFNEKAISYADSVILHTGNKYQLLQGAAYVKMFADDASGKLGRNDCTGNKEIIFAIDLREGNGSNLAKLFYYNGEPQSELFSSSPGLMSLWKPQDLRAGFFKLSSRTGKPETTKHLVSLTYTSQAPLIHFRMAELYLNRAEALAKLGRFNESKNNLRMIHTRAGLPAADIDGLPDDKILEAVLLERRLEFAFEGHISYDYFRNGLPMRREAADYGTEFIVQPTDEKVIFPPPVF